MGGSSDDEVAHGAYGQEILFLMSGLATGALVGLFLRIHAKTSICDLFIFPHICFYPELHNSFIFYHGSS